MLKLLSLFLLFSLTSASVEAKSKKVLYIGDSQSAGYLGNIVYNELLKTYKADQVDVFGISSSSPRHWGDAKSSKNGTWLCGRKGRHNEKFPIPLKSKICNGKSNQAAFDYLLSQKYDHVFIQFLGNSVAFKESYIKNKVSQLVSFLDKEKCVFITTPPHYYTLAENNQKRIKVESYFIEAINGRCKVVRGMTDKNLKTFAKVRNHYQPDKKHLSLKGAEEFFKQFKDLLP